jgi:hypothetical protein
MKEVLVKTSATATVAAVLLVTLMANKAFSQGGGSRGTPPTSVERRQDLSNRQATDYEIEESSRELKKRPVTPADRKHAQEFAEQIKHDFAGLQERHNQIVVFMADKDGFDRNHDSVFRAVAEIKKCAARLKTNLALPKTQHEKSGGEISQDRNIAKLEDSLMALRQHIYNFVTNPLFATAGVLDLEQASKAGLDLDRIIELSESITKRVDKSKQPAKP